MPDTTPHVPTETTKAEVTALVTYGVPQDAIADYIGIDDKTLRKHYRREIDNAKVQAHERVGRFLYQNATGATIADGATHADCVRAAMFWAKTQMGFKETAAVEHTSPDGSMSPKPIDMSKLPREVLEALVAAADADKTND